VAVKAKDTELIMEYLVHQEVAEQLMMVPEMFLVVQELLAKETMVVMELQVLFSMLVVVAVALAQLEVM
jgi:hypothetical protein